MANYPEEVEAFQNALGSRRGVTDIQSAVTCLWGVTPEVLKLVDWGDFPHAAIRWSGGGQESQALAQFHFRLQPSDAGWRALEFIAWWVSDCSRSGTLILRPNALPPSTAQGVQFGRTLKFTIDLFQIGRR